MLKYLSTYTIKKKKSVYSISWIKISDFRENLTH